MLNGCISLQGLEFVVNHSKLSPAFRDQPRLRPGCQRTGHWNDNQGRQEPDRYYNGIMTDGNIDFIMRALIKYVIIFQKTPKILYSKK